jgi:hypothetical protein
MDTAKAQSSSKASSIREELALKPRAKPQAIVATLKEKGVEVTAREVSRVKYDMRHNKARRSKSEGTPVAPLASFPRHPISEVLRIPKAILEQNAGKECSMQECASFIGVKPTSGDFQMALSSATKYGLIERAGPKRVKLGDLARQILRPQDPGQELHALRLAVSKAPQIGDVYNHYRGENLPDAKFLANTLTETFHIPPEKVDDFLKVFMATLANSQLLEDRDGKQRVVDFSSGEGADKSSSERIKKLGKDVQIGSDDKCFVVMPFSQPQGTYYELIYEPAIKKVGLKAVRADNEIFGTGKIMDQIWRGINEAKVLVAELTTKNANVFYELGLAHAMKKPVVLVSANEKDVPFDLQHIRVIYYDVNDPFWGDKLQAKIAENIVSAIKNPEEAIFKGEKT